jgi:diguanylate cyclase (GGDEF)-like protein
MSGGGLGNFSNWTPLFFIYIFLIFNRKKALIISIILYLLSVIIGIAAYPGNNVDKLQALNTLAQFYASTAAYILALFFLQHLKEAYIYQETMNQAANTDFLTGLPNRRMLEKMVDDNRLAPLPTFSVILFDIDLFKEINDTFGHDIGDFVLKEFTELVKKNTRETDLFGRWGGEEFLIIATHQTLEQAMALAERLKSVFSTHTFFEVTTVTASFGVAEWQPGESKEELLKRADIALYRAKEKGRNLVQAAE